jgi:glycosyltransferase involved in cell wall biosynthesis
VETQYKNTLKSYKMARFTVIIPTYNHEEFLSDAIESVLDQTHKAHEVIVVNDGSTDNTLKIAKSYDVKVIDQANKGLAAARNTGLMNSSPESDYILPLDSDDILKENCLEEINKVAEETKADVVSPSFKTFGQHNQDVILAENPTIEHFAKLGNMVAYCSAVKRDVLLEVGGWSPRMDNIYRDAQGNLRGGYEDLHLWFDLLKREKKFVTIQEPLFMYRTRPDSMIGESQQHHNELMGHINKDFQVFR